MLTLNVYGKEKDILRFIHDFQKQSQYQIQTQTEILGNEEKASLSMEITYRPSNPQAMVLHITTTSGKKIQLNLLDGQVTDMGNGITYINGKIYDVFG